MPRYRRLSEGTMGWRGRGMSTRRRRTRALMVLDSLHRLGPPGRREGFAAIRSVRADGRNLGGTAGGRSLKGSGDAAGVVCWQWCGRLFGGNEVTGSGPRPLFLTGIEYRWAC